MGKGRGMHVNYSSSYSIKQNTQGYDVMDGDEFRDYMNDNFSDVPAKLALLGDENIDWQDQIYRLGFTTNQNISLSGNALDETLPYRVSLGYNKDNATVKISNYKFERRLCMFPSFFDKDGLSHSDTSYGDYPHYVPSLPRKQYDKGGFTGWMLLSYRKPVKTSSSVTGHGGNQLVDENISSFWVAAHNNDKQWVCINLGKDMTINALQINFADYHETKLYGRVPNLHQRYSVEVSSDAKSWKTIINRDSS